MSLRQPHLLLAGGLAAIAVAAAAPLAASLSRQEPAAGAAAQEQPATYVGAAKCKNCHNTKEKGEIYDKWAAHPHAKAMETLAGDKAKEFGAARAVAEPQKAPECLKCHQTAFGLDEKLVDKKFPKELGVQCETCHGPGSKHVKARMTAAAKGEGKGEAGPLAIPSGEMSLPNEALCKTCHNPESPGYKEFVYKDFLAKTRHMHPNRAKPRVLAPEEAAAGN